MYDGVHVPVSQLLGKGFRSQFLARYCIPLFSSDPALSGFNAAPRSQHVLDSSVMRVAAAKDSSPVDSVLPEQSYGMYRVKYILSAQVAAHPDAFHRKVPQDGPYPLQNLWTDKEFHYSIL